MIEAVGFDLGGTLVEGIPLKWLSLYRQALVHTAQICGCEISDSSLLAAEEILKRYNVRLNPRTAEVSSDEIFGAILRSWGVPEAELDHVTEVFFSFFTRDACIHDDIGPTLQTLRSAGVKMGVLTDTPYGMPKRLAEMDIAPVRSYLDVVLTSVEVGHRKPDPRGFLMLADRLGIDPSQMVYVGDEPKDVEGAKAAGMLPVLIDRHGTVPACGEGMRLSSMQDLIALIEI